MKKKVIIYDDDADLLEVCSLILGSKGFEVVMKDRCSEVINDLRLHRPDVVLMDNWIPDLGGVAATRLIKDSAEFSGLPVIFFSANNNVTELARDAGADFCLQKPFDIKELESLVAHAAETGPS
jgi:two-component system cell cycle response regulator DivK